MKLLNKILEVLESSNVPIDTTFKFNNRFEATSFFGSISLFKSGYDYYLVDSRNNIEYEFKHKFLKTEYLHNFCMYKNMTEYIGHTFRFGKVIEEEHKDSYCAICHVCGLLYDEIEFSMIHVYLNSSNTCAPPNVLDIESKLGKYTLVYNTKLSTSLSFWPMMVYKNNTEFFRVIDSNTKNKYDFILEYNSIEDINEIMIILGMMLHYLSRD